jgi:hypothetical protein
MYDFVRYQFSRSRLTLIPTSGKNYSLVFRTRCHPEAWPARSPDLTPLGYFSWGAHAGHGLQATTADKKIRAANHGIR